MCVKCFYARSAAAAVAAVTAVFAIHTNVYNTRYPNLTQHSHMRASYIVCMAGWPQNIQIEPAAVSVQKPHTSRYRGRQYIQIASVECVPAWLWWRNADKMSMSKHHCSYSGPQHSPPCMQFRFRQLAILQRGLIKLDFQVKSNMSFNYIFFEIGKNIYEFSNLVRLLKPSTIKVNKKIVRQ